MQEEQFVKELAVILKTRASASITRAAKLNILPTCHRCGGSGQYSYNQIDGSRCYGCNGTGARRPTQKQFPNVIKLAHQAAEDGSLDKLIDRQRRAAYAKKGQTLVMGAWKASDISSQYCWRKAAEFTRTGDESCKRDREISEINAKMAAAFDTCMKLKGTAEDADVVDAALETVENARLELVAYLKTSQH